jgi:hypothetical protein
LWREDGGPIYVRVLGSEFPVEEPGSGPYKYVFPWKAKWLCNDNYFSPVTTIRKCHAFEGV